MNMRNTLLAAAVLAVVLLLQGSPALAGTTEEAQRRFNRGMAAVELARSEDDYRLAAKEFSEAARLAPDWADAHYNLGLVLQRAGDHLEAARALRRYLEIAPNAADAAAVRAMADKEEFLAERVITREDVRDIVSTLTNEALWETKAIKNGALFHRPKWFNSIEKINDGALRFYFPSGLCGYNGTGDNNGMPDEERRVEVSTFYCMCDENTDRDMCAEVVKYEFEVVSRDKVTMSMRYFYPSKLGGGTEDALLEFVRR